MFMQKPLSLLKARLSGWLSQRQSPGARRKRRVVDRRLSALVEYLEDRVLLADPGATVATAVNLGSLTPTKQTAIDRLQSGDVDLFRFNLPSDSTLSANVTGLTGQVNGRLFRDLNSDGVLASDEQLEYRDNYYSGSAFNMNGESLAGGTYFLQLAPSNATTNTPYTLTISATAIPNSLDVGGTTATARNLGTLTTTQKTVNDIAQWGDADIFKFTLSADSTLSATFSGLSELVQARLYRDLNNDGVLAGDEQLESRDNYYSGATFNFNGESLMKGTYFLQVSPWNSEANTAYTLAISAASIPGSKDAGGTTATARDFATLTTAVKTVNDISQWNDTDVYKFTVSTDSVLSAAVSGLSELVRARLFRDLNGDGVLASDEQLELRDNYYSGAAFNFNGEALMKGTYFLQVSPWNSEVNTAYTLAISATAITGSQDGGDTTATARDFGTLTTAVQTVNDISQWNDTDVYKFTVSTDSVLSATVSGLSELVRARLFRDLNGDGVLASDEQLEIRDNYYSGATLTFNGESLMKGTYFLQVSPWNSEVNTAYTLAISAAAIPGSQDAGGTASTARDFGTLTTALQTVNDIAQWSDTDVYKFTVSTDSILSATVSGLSELVRARLFRDLNGDGVLASDEQVEIRDNYYSGATLTFNGEPLMKGTYYLQVSPWNSEVNTAYTLAISAATIPGSQDAGGTTATARDFGTLTTAVQTVNDIAQWSDTDVYKFTVSTDSTLSTTITGLSELVQVRLFRDLNGDGILASGDQLEIRDNYYSGATLTFNGEPLMKGTYYLQVSPGNSEVNTAYTLAISAATIAGSQDAGGTTATARDFGTLTTAQKTVNDIAQSGDNDIFKFTLSTDSTLSTTLTGLSELVQARLFRDRNGDGILTSDEQLEVRDNYYSGATLTFNGEPLMKGTYYLQVSPWNSEVNTAYTLAISAAAIPGSIDAGGTVATARNLGTLAAAAQTVKDLAQSGDNDIYKFTLAPGAKLKAAITGLTELVQARLYRDLNNDGILTANEQIAYRDNYSSGAGFDFNGLNLAGATYFLQISPWNTDVNTEYQLAVSAV